MFSEFDQSFLLLVSTIEMEQNSLYCKAVYYLEQILKRQGDIKVLCNLWSVLDISDPIEWTHDQVKNFSDVILFCTPVGKANWEHFNCFKTPLDPFVVGVQACQKNEKRKFINEGKNFYVVYVDNETFISVPEVLQTSIPSLKIPEEIKKLFPGVKTKTDQKLKDLWSTANKIRSELELFSVQLAETPLLQAHAQPQCNNGTLVPVSEPSAISYCESQDETVLSTFQSCENPSCQGSLCSCQYLPP